MVAVSFSAVLIREAHAPALTVALYRNAFAAAVVVPVALVRRRAELRRLTGHVEELHFLDLAGRLARRLVQLSEQATPATNGEVALDWPYTQSDLAAMIGGTRQSVNKLLGDLISDGLVRIERDTLTVTDAAALARRAAR